jgi:hypothetical protein
MDDITDNPFYNALPEWLSEEEFTLLITGAPSKCTSKNIFDKIKWLRRLKRNLFIVMPWHYDFYLTVRGILDDSYHNRNYKSFIEAVRKIALWRLNPGKLPKLVESPVLGTSLVGDIGMGKSKFFEKLLSLFPEKIDHKEHGVTQVPIVKVDCTSKGSLGQIFLSIFTELDRLTQEDYYKRFSKLTVERMIIEIAGISKINQLGMIVIDEINNLSSETTETSKRIINSLKKLTNEIGIPIIYVGTPEANDVLFSNLQIGSRSQDIGYTELRRLTYNEHKTGESNSKTDENNQFTYFLDCLWNYSAMDEPTPLTKEIVDLYYKETKGLIRYIMNIHINSQIIAISAGSKNLKVDHIKTAIARHMGGTRKLIQGIGPGQMMPEVHTSNKKPSAEDPMSKVRNELFIKIKKTWPQISKDKIHNLITFSTSKQLNLSLDEYFEIIENKILDLFETVVINGDEKKEKPQGELIEITKNSKSNEDNYLLLLEGGKIPEDLSLNTILKPCQGS